MNQLFIIGNGFDLAHGLPTRYEDFLLWYFQKAHKIWLNTGQFEDANIKIADKHSKSPPINMSLIDSFPRYKEVINGHRDIFSISNQLLNKILYSHASNWASIEYQYFDCIVSDVLQHTYQIENLNRDLNQLKDLLQDYLKTEIEPRIEKLKALPRFRDLFNVSPSPTTTARPIHRMVLNFNYTKTFSRLYSFDTDSIYHQLVHIHGEVANSENPIIFGFGDDYFDEYKILENKNEPAFLENIKAMAYSKTDSFSRLQDFLSLKQSFDISIIGHSCGISDRTLLKRIFQSEYLKKIRYYHFEDRDDHFYRTIEISRHFDDNGVMNGKLFHFNKKYRCPQITD